MAHDGEGTQPRVCVCVCVKYNHTTALILQQQIWPIVCVCASLNVRATPYSCRSLKGLPANTAVRRRIPGAPIKLPRDPQKAALRRAPYSSWGGTPTMNGRHPSWPCATLDRHAGDGYPACQLVVGRVPGLTRSGASPRPPAAAQPGWIPVRQGVRPTRAASLL